MRHRILSSAPALDLVRLECTPVASGLNIDEIWKSLLKATNKYRDQSSEPEKPFQLNISRDYHRNLFSRLNAAIREIIKDLSDIKGSELISTGNRYLTEMASDLLKGKI